jgi:hypothetical protein
MLLHFSVPGVPLYTLYISPELSGCCTCQSLDSSLHCIYLSWIVRLLHLPVPGHSSLHYKYISKIVRLSHLSIPGVPLYTVYISPELSGCCTCQSLDLLSALCMSLLNFQVVAFFSPWTSSLHCTVCRYISLLKCQVVSDVSTVYTYLSWNIRLLHFAGETLWQGKDDNAVVTLLRKNRSACAFLDFFPHTIYQFADPRPIILACSDPDSTVFCKVMTFLEQYFGIVYTYRRSNVALLHHASFKKHQQSFCSLVKGY